MDTKETILQNPSEQVDNTVSADNQTCDLEKVKQEQVPPETLTKHLDTLPGLIKLEHNLVKVEETSSDNQPKDVENIAKKDEDSDSDDSSSDLDLDIAAVAEKPDDFESDEEAGPIKPVVRSKNEILVLIHVPQS
jgi:hypothetical protein